MPIPNPITITADIKTRVFAEEKTITANDSLVLIATITDGGTLFDLTSVTNATLVVTRLDRVTVPILGTIVGETIEFKLSREATKVSGSIKAVIQLYDANEDRVSTIKGTLVVEADPTGDTLIVNVDDRTLIQEVLYDGPTVIESAQLATLGALEAGDSVDVKIAETEVVKLATETVKDETLVVKDATQLVQDETLIVKNDMLLVKADAEAATIYTTTQGDYAKTEADRLVGTDVSVLDNRLTNFEGETTALLADMENETKRNFLKPSFIEYFASFSKFGLGTPAGVANYTGGNYVLTVSGNAGDSFLTVLSGNIADSGLTDKYPCVIKNDDGFYDLNKAMGTDSINKINLLLPLKKNITSGVFANLQNAVNGQHYTEHGYFAFTQHFYFATPRYAERNEVINQFLPTDTTGKWVISGTSGYNQAIGMLTGDNTLKQIGSKRMYLYTGDVSKYVEWEEELSSRKGYLETFIGTDSGTAKVEFYLDGLLVDTKQVTREVQRLIFPFEYSKKGKIKISGLGGFPQYINIGSTSWFINQKYSQNRLISPNDKVVFMGDSWGEYSEKATTRELDRLMRADGGTPTILNYSKGGHTSDYAKEWFEEYVLANNPDVVVIEYFTNDFNSINGTNVGTFTNPTGQQQDMNIASMTEYVTNLQWIIDKSIEYGIKPIVIMPAAPNTSSQTQLFADKAIQIWNGNKITNDKPYFAEATISKTTTNTIEANPNSDISIKAKSVNSAVRVGLKIDSDQTLTGGDIGGFYNNGVRKVGIKYDGTVEMKQVQIQPITNYNDIPLDARGRGVIFYVDESVNYGGGDTFYVVIKDSTGAFVRKKLSLV